MSERELALRVTHNAIPVLGQIDVLYNAAVNEDQRCRAITASYEHYRKNLGNILGWTGGFLIFFIVTTFFMFAEYQWGWDISFTVSMVVGLCPAVACYFLIRHWFQAPCGQIRKAQAVSSQYIRQASAEIDQIALDNQDVINQLPRDYRCYDAAVYLEYVLANRLADTMKEAMHLYQMMLHQRRMENYQQQLILANQRQAHMLTAIEQNTRLTSQAAASIALSYIIRSTT